MKKTITSLVVRSIILGGSLFITNSAFAVSFTEAPQVEKRVMPGADGILSYYDAIKTPRKSVVNIFTKKTVQPMQGGANPLMNDPMFRQFFGGMVPEERAQSSLGSGVILTSDGYIVTNNHVIGGADKVMVVLPGEKREISAKVVGIDPKSDLAVIKIDVSSLTPIKFADSSKVKEGDVAFAIGNPFGVGETVTHGIISAIGKSGVGINEYEDFLQTDAPINPGNSGGALVDSRGALVGVNTAIVSQTGQSGGIGFAIPSNMVKNIAKQLIENGKIERGIIGVTMQDLDEKARKSYGKDGIVVLGVAPGSPAAKAGIKTGDLMVALNGKKVENAAGLKNEVGTMKPGDIIKLDIFRDGKISTVDIRLEKAEALGEVNNKVGFELASGLFVGALTDQLRKNLNAPRINGVVVMDIAGGFGAKSGLQLGDIITQIGDMEIKSMVDAQSAKAKFISLSGKRIFAIRRGVPIMFVVE